MNSFEEAFYSIKPTLIGINLNICSFWYPVRQDPIFPLCKLWVLHNNSLFYSDREIFSSSCNTSLLLNNFFTRLKSAFHSKTSEFDLNFLIEDEENTASLELRLIINPQKETYISAFKVTLIRSFKGNPVQEFMEKISEVCRIKDQTISDQKNEILKFNDIYEKINNTREQVKIMREETGVKLAAKFMVLMNQIKEKSSTHQQLENSKILHGELEINPSEKKLKKK